MYSSCLAVSETILQKINSHVWFVQTIYGKWKSFYGKLIPMFGSFKHFTENEIRFTENQFPCLVCGSFYGKYKMPYKFRTYIV